MFGLSSKDELNKMIKELRLNNLIAIDPKPDFNIPINSGIIFDVFNFADSHPNIGHWILFKRISNDSCILIDSYGVYHQNLIDELMKVYKNIIIVLDQQQNLNSQSCGYYSILNYYLLERNLYKPNNYILIQNSYYKFVDNNIKQNRYDQYENIYNEFGI